MTVEEILDQVLPAYEKARANGHVVLDDGPEEPAWMAAERAEAEDYEARNEQREDRSPADDEFEASWYTPIDLSAVLAGTTPQPRPAVLSMVDDRGSLFYPGAINGLHGDSGSCKTWLAQLATAQCLAAGRSVVVLDFESSHEEWAARLAALGVDPVAITERLIYLNPVTPAMPDGKRPSQPHEAIRRLVELIRARGNVDLVVIDSIGEAFGLEGIDENADKEVGPWLRWVVRPLADAGPAVATLDHSNKAGDNPLHPSGSKRKRAAVTGASYLVTSSTPPTKESVGWVDVTCAKDRHGNYRRGEKVAVLELRPAPAQRVIAVLRRREAEEQQRGTDYVLGRLVAEVVAVVKAADAPLSGRGIRARVPTQASHDLKLAAIEEAVTLGCLAAEKVGAAQLHSWVKDPPTEAVT